MTQEKIYSKDEPSTIREMFNHIAQRYDITNYLMSFSLHKRWNQRLIQKLLVTHQPLVLADLCCGTGDIALNYLKNCKSPSKGILIDFSPDMLEIAKKKSRRFPVQHHTLQFIEADVQAIPLPDQSVDRATMAYGIRNVKEPLVCLKEVYRILKPGALFGILELTKPKNKILKQGHSLYLKTVVPFFGKLLTTNREAYNYLQNSIHHFVEADQLEILLREAGFNRITKEILTGGTATILIAYKEK